MGRRGGGRRFSHSCVCARRPPCLTRWVAPWGVDRPKHSSSGDQQPLGRDRAGNRACRFIARAAIGGLGGRRAFSFACACGSQYNPSARDEHPHSSGRSSRTLQHTLLHGPDRPARRGTSARWSLVRRARCSPFPLHKTHPGSCSPPVLIPNRRTQQRRAKHHQVHLLCGLDLGATRLLTIARAQQRKLYSRARSPKKQKKQKTNRAPKGSHIYTFV